MTEYCRWSRRHRSQSHPVAAIAQQCSPTAPAETRRRCRYRERRRFSRAVFYLIDLPASNSLLRCQTETRLRSACAVDHRRHVLTNRWSMFEAVTRSAADEPNILQFRMTIDQEVAIRRVFVLANARFQNWRARKRRNPPGEILSRRL